MTLSTRAAIPHMQNIITSCLIEICVACLYRSHLSTFAGFNFPTHVTKLSQVDCEILDLFAFCHFWRCHYN